MDITRSRSGNPTSPTPPSPEQAIDFSDLQRLTKLVDRYLGRPGNPHPKLFLSEWTIPTAVNDEFDFYVEPSLQAKWITAGLKYREQLVAHLRRGLDPSLRQSARNHRGAAVPQRHQEARLLRLEGWLMAQPGRQSHS